MSTKHSKDFKVYQFLILSLPVPHWADENTDLPSNSYISKTIRVNIVFISAFFKEYSMSFLVISRLIEFAFVVF